MKPKGHKPLIDPMECERMDKSAIWSKYELERDTLLTKLEEAQRLMAEFHPDPCPHNWTNSQGLGRPAVCGQCGEEL